MRTSKILFSGLKLFLLAIMLGGVLSATDLLSLTAASLSSSAKGEDNLITTGIWSLDAPLNLGYNVNEGDDYASPRPNTELACGGVTNINGVSHHWTDAAGGLPLIKYQRQYDVPSTPADTWSGNEIYNSPYSDYRTFGGSPGSEGSYNSRVRAFYDENDNDQLDSWEVRSKWSPNDCFITFDQTPPAVELTNLADGQVLSGTFDIYATVDDDNPDHYSLTAEKVGGGQVTGFPGTVIKKDLFINQFVYSWNTTLVEDGQYIVKLEATDEAGNHHPVTSVDWKTVVVDNAPSQVGGLTLYRGHDVAARVEIGCSGVTDTTNLTIAWGSSPESDVIGYWFGTKFNDHHKFVTAPTHEYHGHMTPGNNIYDYTVIAVDAAGHESSISDRCYAMLEQGIVSTTPSTSLVINEVQADLPTSEQWVELYNKDSVPISLENWTLQNEFGFDTLPPISIPAGGFAVVVTNQASPALKSAITGTGAVLVEIDSETIGSGLVLAGDKLILKNSAVSVVDQLSWGSDTSILTLIAASSGQSLVRNPLGVDTDTAGDWQVNVAPNPGTNPHSHIGVDLIQDQQSLLINFTQAYGFTSVKYAVSYQRQLDGQLVTEQLVGQLDKDKNELTATTGPLYIGTCSSAGLVCVPHVEISEMKVDLLYQDEGSILGTSSYDFNWLNQPPPIESDLESDS